MIPLLSPIPQMPISHPLATLFFCFSGFRILISSCLRVLAICQFLRSLPDWYDSAHHSYLAHKSPPQRGLLWQLYLLHPTNPRLIHIVPLPSFLCFTFHPVPSVSAQLWTECKQSIVSLWSSTIISSWTGSILFLCIFCLLSHPQFLQRHLSLYIYAIYYVSSFFLFT